jgi:preprotein translocase subunit SecD
MKQNKFLLAFIFLITVYAALINLPNTHLKFNLGPIKIDRDIHPLGLNIEAGPVSIQKSFPIRFGLDLSGGTHLVLEADMKDIKEADRKNAYDSAKTVVERRVNLYGLTEPVIQQSKVGNAPEHSSDSTSFTEEVATTDVSLNTEQGAAPAAMAAVGVASSQMNKPPHRNNKKLAAIVTLVVAFILAGVAVFVYLSANNNTAEDTNTSNSEAAQTSAKKEVTPATAEDVDQTNTNVDEALKSVDEAADFAEADLSDASLGL